MAFPSSTGSIPLTLEAAWEQARVSAAMIKQNAQDKIAAAAAGIDGRTILALASFLSDQYAQLNTLAAIGGLGDYAQAQVNNPSLDVAGAFTAMTTAVASVVSWITTNFPKDGNGNLLFAQLTDDGHTTYTVFTSTQLQGLVSALTALVATID